MIKLDWLERLKLFILFTKKKKKFYGTNYIRLFYFSQ